eukprot:CAMPEP_0194406474 /NCGR_PEP_ID=MMETSP0176-20130528/4669_1 /TAXON_ID=216777 /ORGANISM="Proboscia alata, Strain PI-D3" /LENGTH=530 /DNA_ID=CAMNT_0039205695 /DNA_START=75 /DNA_END=1667 /DNA_ORIENTATION=+
MSKMIAVEASKPLRSLLQTEGKTSDIASLGAFLGILVAIPIWAVTVLPLSIGWQVGKALLQPLLGKKSTPGSGLDTARLSADAPADVDSTIDIIPQSDRKYDVVLLGASGYTGKFAVTHLMETYGIDGDVKWAVAGRNKTKLSATLESVARELNLEASSQTVSSVDILLVDTSDPSTLPNLVKHTRVVATTAGPFQLYGSPVVEFCAKYGTHYVDITGEMDWVRTMILQHEGAAQRTGSKIVSLCGHDSVPWDLTVMKLAEGMKEHDKEEELVEVSIVNDIKAAASGGTMATMKLAVGGEMIVPPKTEFDPLMRLRDGTKSLSRTKLALPAFISSMQLPKESGRVVTAPFVMSAVNGSVVKRSHALRGRNDTKTSPPLPPPTLVYREARSFADVKSALVDYLGTILFLTALLNPVTSKLIDLLQIIPEPGSVMGNISKQTMTNEFYLSVAAVGIGSKGTKLESILYFDRDPGYIDTARMLIESALCLAMDHDVIPKQGGGFYTPSTAFGNVLLDRLCKRGTHFQMRLVQE